MRLHVVTWTVLCGLLGPLGAQARPTDHEVPVPRDPGAPLWSICATFSQPAGRGTLDSTHEERPRSAIKIRLPRNPETGALETLSTVSLAEDAGHGTGHCVPWGPGITGASSGSDMSASGRDEGEIPICLEGAQCSPVSPSTPTAAATFTAAKATASFASLPGQPLGFQTIPDHAQGDAHAGYPHALFEPPR